jgi:hypothetical protein
MFAKQTCAARHRGCQIVRSTFSGPPGTQTRGNVRRTGRVPDGGGFAVCGKVKRSTVVDRPRHPDAASPLGITINTSEPLDGGWLTLLDNSTPGDTSSVPAVVRAGK